VALTSSFDTFVLEKVVPTGSSYVVFATVRANRGSSPSCALRAGDQVLDAGSSNDSLALTGAATITGTGPAQLLNVICRAPTGSIFLPGVDEAWVTNRSLVAVQVATLN
jgi:inactivated superfamily I helicase